MRVHGVTGAVLAVVGLGMGLACAGLGGADGGTPGAAPVSVRTDQDGPEVYDGIDWTGWKIFADPFSFDLSCDDTVATSDWLGGQSEPFSVSGDDVTMTFPEGTAHLRALDACHLGGRGPHPKDATADPLVYRMTRSWPSCHERDCTYGDVAFTTWRVHAREYKFNLSFDDQHVRARWVGEVPTPWTRSGDTVTIDFPKGTLTLTQLDRCHWAGRGPHPKEDGVTLDYRLNRVWPDCGCK